MISPRRSAFDPTYAPQLLAIAEGDLQSALALLGAPQPGRLENILFLIQQAVEKALKAVLIAKQVDFPLVHYLGILIALLPASEYPPGGFELTALNPYASIRRYETGPLVVSLAEVQGAYNGAVLVLEWAKPYIDKN